MRLKVLATGSIAFLLLTSAAQAQAQETEPPSTSARDIVVTGRAQEEPTNREVSRQARAVTRPQNMYDGPLARFEDRLCPGIMGLQEEHAGLMIDRIRYNAEALDMWMASEEGCTPNFIVAFVRNGQEEIAALERRHGYLFASLPVDERKELLAETGPVRVWTTTAMRSRDGMEMSEGQGLTDPPTVTMWSAHSKIYLPVREDITQVVVVFDLEQVRGKTLLQLADYATMRGLARTRPVEDDPSMDTILTLFHSDAPPTGMTRFDRAYLAALYDSIPNLPGITKLLGVNRQLRLQEAAEARRPAGGE